MPAYAVKHLVDEHGPLSRVMRDVRKTPYSFTSKEPEATLASSGRQVYVFEVNVDGGKRTYSLGYRYKASEKFTLAGGGLWKDEFKFKVSATPGLPADGVYFDTPVAIADRLITAWLSTKQPGMAEIPADLIPLLMSIEADPANDAKPFV